MQRRPTHRGEAAAPPSYKGMGNKVRYCSAAPPTGEEPGWLRLHTKAWVTKNEDPTHRGGAGLAPPSYKGMGNKTKKM